MWIGVSPWSSAVSRTWSFFSKLLFTTCATLFQFVKKKIPENFLCGEKQLYCSIVKNGKKIAPIVAGSLISLSFLIDIHSVYIIYKILFLSYLCLSVIFLSSIKICSSHNADFY